MMSVSFCESTLSKKMLMCGTKLFTEVQEYVNQHYNDDVRLGRLSTSTTDQNLGAINEDNFYGDLSNNYKRSC